MIARRTWSACAACTPRCSVGVATTTTLSGSRDPPGTTSSSATDSACSTLPNWSRRSRRSSARALFGWSARQLPRRVPSLGSIPDAFDEAPRHAVAHQRPPVERDGADEPDEAPVDRFHELVSHTKLLVREGQAGEL